MQDSAIRWRSDSVQPIEYITIYFSKAWAFVADSGRARSEIVSIIDARRSSCAPACPILDTLSDAQTLRAQLVCGSHQGEQLALHSPRRRAVTFLHCGPARAQRRDPNVGRSLAATCANCHGTNGVAVGEVVSLAASRRTRSCARCRTSRPDGCRDDHAAARQGLHGRADRLVAGMVRGAKAK